MTPLDRTTEGFTAALEALVLPDLDVADVLAHLVADCAEATGADACALMARDGRGELSLLAAESHRAVELEMWQIQRHTGPCVDVIQGTEALRQTGADAIRARWGEVGDAIVDAGFATVESFPMRWRGEVLGGLNLFSSGSDHRTTEALAQAYADMATLVVVQSASVDADQVRARLHEALTARGIVEQAKGVLAYRDDVDLGEAYARLLREAERSGKPLTLAASDVVAQAAGVRP